ncbi:MurR/RpiR family transcriptional regulator [Carnobacterium inhibens]|uniref:Sugar isomerase n=1 Tax=Carnobacterium inhibens subsp. gilichinskyi TaxID=1266845 RepID=U5SBB2_9LACT|nr:MurR/RpiR family transcriptional regulator [Carnobacterium inhibens]AGY82579.1 sugar isomerase [Carnobacterium inhibens subsp. gilichinskyi]
MLLIERLKHTSFSDAEQVLVSYLIDHPEGLQDMTTQKIADLTHTNPTSLIRVAKKMGFKGWLDLKEAYLEEWQYLNSHFTAIDANLPYEQTDHLISIAHKINTLQQNTLQDTLSLIDSKDLEHAQKLLLNADEIKVFASKTNALIAQDFVTKMRRINKKVTISSTYDYSTYEAFNSGNRNCALIISYTGEDDSFIKCMDILKKQGASIVSLTSIGDNPIATHSDCSLKITTREKLYSKIGNFTSTTSVIYLLNLLYSIVFTADYEMNLNHLIQIGRSSDTRKTTIDIIKE